jgi:hypothetical protein
LPLTLVRKGSSSVHGLGECSNVFHPISGERLTVSERVYLDFRRGIASGDFKPGQPLIVRNMTVKFKVSRTPVIEANKGRHA